MNVGEKIIALRERKGWSTNRLSKEAGISQSSMRYIEIGENSPTIETLNRILLALDTKLEDFWTIPDDREIINSIGDELFKNKDHEEWMQFRSRTPEEQKERLDRAFDKLKNLPPEAREAFASLIEIYFANRS